MVSNRYVNRICHLSLTLTELSDIVRKLLNYLLGRIGQGVRPHVKN